MFNKKLKKQVLQLQADIMVQQNTIANLHTALDKLELDNKAQEAIIAAQSLLVTTFADYIVSKEKPTNAKRIKIKKGKKDDKKTK